MSTSRHYQPPYTITPAILNRVVAISEFIGRLTALTDQGRALRLWQTLILSRWNRLFADIPVESLIHEHQTEYYQALQSRTDQTDSAPFIEFMLRMILDAVSSAAPQVAPQVTPKSNDCWKCWKAR